MHPISRRAACALTVIALGCGGEKRVRDAGPADSGAQDLAADTGSLDSGAPDADDAPAEGSSRGACKADLLFVIDNSASMDEEQANLIKNFKTMIDALKDLPGGLPDVHIGVVSSSLGAGAATDVPGCPPGGDKGILQNKARGDLGTCTTVPSDHWISASADGKLDNFTGDVSDAFACIAELGAYGCGLEHQIAAAARALGVEAGGFSEGAPPENDGFLRDEATLAIVFITDEDDCSAPIDSDLFDTSQTSCSDPLGPLVSYRCTEYGILCAGEKPPHCPAAATPLSDCVSAEDDGKLIAVDPLVAGFEALKAESKAPVVVAAITGPSEPVSTSLTAAGNPELGPSCSSTNGNAAPAVRLNQFVAGFGDHGLSISICEDDFAPAMKKIGEFIRSAVATIGC